MNRKPNLPAAAIELRRRAEARLRGQRKGPRSKAGARKPRAAPREMLHELEVHDVELEMQNAELQEARNALEMTLEKYTDLYDFAPVGYFSLNEAGVILEANLTGAGLLGVERSRLINRHLPRLAAPASQPVLLAFLKRVFAGTGNQVCEAALLKQDTTAFWASFHGIAALAPNSSKKWCRVAVSDITSRKQVEEALRTSKERLRALFEAGPVAIYSCDASGMIREFNRRAVELWGREPALADPKERFCGSFKLFRPEGSLLHHEQCPMAEVLSGKKSEVRDAEVLVERRDGRRITVIVNIRRLQDEHGKVTGAINCFYDITDRKRAEQVQHRVEVLAASNQKLEQQIVLRRQIEQSLKQSEERLNQSLAQSRLMQEQLRLLSRQILSSQEEERKRISRELHDVIAQTLTGINIRLANLKKEAGHNTRHFARSIARTQELVEHSVNIVHRFARELRPAVLDDLGLIPALLAFMKNFTTETGVRTHLTAFAGVEQLDAAQRTVLFRVAQEALNNVARHARASRVDVSIQKLPHRICMKIKDDGKSFRVEPALHANGSKRLGLLGMRERLEMVGGNFGVQSAPGQGTTIEAQIPLARTLRGALRIVSAEIKN